MPVCAVRCGGFASSPIDAVLRAAIGTVLGFRCEGSVAGSWWYGLVLVVVVIVSVVAAAVAAVVVVTALVIFG